MFGYLTRSVTLAILALVVAGCGSEDAMPFPGGGSGLFPGLSGEFLLDDYCLLTLNGSTGEIDCDESGSDSFETWTDEYDIDLQIAETRITMSGTNTWLYDYHDWDEQSGGELTVTTSANRSVGRQSEGRFSALAGDWTGTLEYTESWYDVWDEGREREDWSDSGTVTFSASIDGDSATVSWTSDGDSGEFVVRAVAGGIDVGGEFVREL